MTLQDLASLVSGGLIGLGASTAFILVLFLGFCTLFGLSKLRATAGGRFRVIRSLEERAGQAGALPYLPPDAPHGPVDQLRTPELIERGRAI